MLQWAAKLRELSGGKPVGIKLCVGQPHEVYAVMKAMLETGIRLDYIVVDGAEGGTGAAPVEFSNRVGDRKSVVEGKSLSVWVDPGGCRLSITNTHINYYNKIKPTN